MVYRGSPRQVYDHATHKARPYPHPLMVAPTLLAGSWLIPLLAYASMFNTFTMPGPTPPMVKLRETIVV